MEPELRAPTLDDLPELVAFFAGLHERYGIRLRTEAELRDGLVRARENASENYRIAPEGDRIAAYVGLWAPSESPSRVFFGANTLPRDRRLYGVLVDWADRRARELAPGGRAQAPAESDDAELCAELESRGYERARWFFEMEIDLEEEPPSPVWPEGLAVRRFEPTDARAVYETDLEAFEDHWEPLHVSFDEWREYFLSSSEFDPGLWFLAEENGVLAGVAMCKGGGEEGRVDVLAVRRPWRKRGLGLALLLHSFRELRSNGCARAALAVDGENLTGAVRLYERAGMNVARREAIYLKDLT